MDVLVVDVERELPRLDALLHAPEPARDGVGVNLRDDARLRQHGRVRLRAGDVLRIERLVNRQRGAEALRELAHVLREPA